MQKLTLYGKPDCPLCDKMKDVVERVRGVVPFSLEVVSIETDAALFDRFWKDIPVLVEGTTVLFRHRLTEEALVAALAGRRQD